MPKPIQLSIPTPCHESWAHMRPEEKGRYCGSCQKTVVDFSAMTDTEVVNFFMHARENVCGRLAPDQLGRNMAAVEPPKKSRWRYWQWVVTGVLMAFGEPNTHRPGTKGEVELKEVKPPKEERDLFVGKLAAQKIDLDTVEEVPVRTVVCKGEMMGDVALVRLAEDSVKDTLVIPVGSPKLTLPVKGEEVMVTVGGIMPVLIIEKEDTSRLVQVIRDTLSFFLPAKKELVVYPNPVPRGGSVHISWQAEVGTYQVALYSMSGALISQRVLEVTGKGQVDDWAIPAGIASGIYLIRAVTTNGKSYTRQLVVE